MYSSVTDLRLCTFWTAIKHCHQWHCLQPNWRFPIATNYTSTLTKPERERQTEAVWEGSKTEWRKSCQRILSMWGLLPDCWKSNPGGFSKICWEAPRVCKALSATLCRLKNYNWIRLTNGSLLTFWWFQTVNSFKCNVHCAIYLTIWCISSSAEDFGNYFDEKQLV